MATSLERIEDDVQKMVEDLVNEALATALSGLDERIEKIEQFIANLGPLAKLSERVSNCEQMLISQTLEVEANGDNIDLLLEESKLSGRIYASFQGQISSINERLAGVVSASEDAAVALYGGEQ